MLRMTYRWLPILAMSLLLAACSGGGGSEGGEESGGGNYSNLTSGIDLYANACAGCHGSLETSAVRDRSATEIHGAIHSVERMDELENLTSAQIQAIADALNSSGDGNANQPADGATLYADNCAVCHGQLAASAKAGRSSTAIQAAIDGNVGGMGGLNSLTPAEVQAIAAALQPTSGGNSGSPADGATLYADNCAVCHGQLAASAKAGRSSTAIQAAIDGNVGGMGGLNSLTAAEVQAIADALASSSGNGNTGPDYSNCTACHSQPPDGTAYPNTAGAHAAHREIAAIGTQCLICHQSASHNGSVELAFPVNYNAKNSVATDNLDGTCSSISCHGGKMTPDWWSGSINLTSQCSACHSSGTSQYNSYHSGRHSKHSRYNCTVCHNSSRMSSHIGDPATPNFEVSAASTIGGSGTNISSYSGGRCNGCHGSATW